MTEKSEIRFLPLGARRLAYEVRGDGPPLVAPAWWVSHLELDWQSPACQDKLLQSWRVFAGGCVCNRPTLELMRACGFAVEADDVVWHGMPAIVHPLAVGCAARLSVGHASR